MAGQSRTSTGLIVLFVLLGAPVALLVSAFVVMGVAVEMQWMPDTVARPGDEMPDHYRTWLEDHDLLDADETVHWYYSDGFFSFSEDGQYFTDRRVVSYIDDGAGFEVGMATYPEIVDIQVSWNDELFMGSSVSVSTVDGSDFYLIVSNEAGKDHDFIEHLLTTWEERN